jgi:two-component system, NarL family, nitrate/nitrite response regulator NarL
MPLLQLLVVTEDPLLSHAVAALLERSPRIRSDRASSLAETREHLRRSTPHAIVWWVRHADATTFDTIGWIREECGVPVCVVASSIDVGALRAALTRCADRLAVVVRDCELKPAGLFRVLVQLVAGRAVLSPVLLEQLLRDAHADEQDILSRLTPSELAVLDLVAMGFRNPEIARRVGRSAKLVEKNVGRIFTKLELRHSDGVTDRRVTAVRMYLLATRECGKAPAPPPFGQHT